VPGIRGDILLTVDAEWRKTRLFRSQQQVVLASAIADSRTMLRAARGEHVMEARVDAARMWFPVGSGSNHPQTAP
jgi:hypothetical protein